MSEPAETGTNVPIRVLAQVRNLEVIAQQIVPIQLYERIQVKQSFDTQRCCDYQRHIVWQRGWISKPPENGGQCPAKNLEPSPGQRHQQTLALFRKKPGVTYVAIHCGLQVNQQQTDFVDLAAKSFAREPVREFVTDDNADQS